MDNLSDLLSGTKIGEQHEYFQLAKNDIYILALYFSSYRDYDVSELSLINKIETNPPDLYQLNIVIQYIITYGSELFILYLSNMKVDSYNKSDFEQYISEYIENLSSYIK